MRNRYVISYDVADPKRLAKVFKKMRGFGDSVQLSVFQCDLSRQELILVKSALLRLINEREDKVVIVDCGPVGGRGEECFEFLGKRDAPGPKAAVVI
jgi:CRISPR-associated protein Cas2